ncbi:MAG: electron transfer flavoprotein subunit beta/FixA family protein [Smithellaceae bacterium]|nr:electron transfer flavoprotein subunit beta/FixA family protein [Smithellaceae bacterium]
MGINIICCIKALVTEAPAGPTIRKAQMCALNPFDRPTLEQALRLKEELGGTVTALSMGPDDCTFALYEALALGVDRAVLLCDRALAGSDTLATSTALAAAVEKLTPCDILIFGTRTSDSDTGQVGPQTAVLLNMPIITWSSSVMQSGGVFRVERRADGYHETYETKTPFALTVHPAALTPRDVALSGLEHAYEKQKVERWNLAKLGLSAAAVGDAGSPTKVVSLTRVSKERRCTLISGSPDEQADLLIAELLKLGVIG